jgi:hypothetical protein
MPLQPRGYAQKLTLTSAGTKRTRPRTIATRDIASIAHGGWQSMARTSPYLRRLPPWDHGQTSQLSLPSTLPSHKANPEPSRHSRHIKQREANHRSEEDALSKTLFNLQDGIPQAAIGQYPTPPSFGTKPPDTARRPFALRILEQEPRNRECTVARSTPCSHRRRSATPRRLIFPRG